MQALKRGLAVLACWGVASSAGAACLPEGPPAQVFTTRSSPQPTGGLLAVAGMLLTMDAYQAKNLRRMKADCEVATLRRGKTAYAVSGTADPALPRIMTANDRKAPLLFLMTVPDIQGAMLKRNEPPVPLGYVLVSQADATSLLYRAYDVIPPDVQLASDVGAALEGRIPAMLSADLTTHQVTISVAAGAGEVTEKQAGAAAGP